MTSLNTLRETRAARVAEMRGLSEAAQASSRDLDDAERKRFDALEGEVRGLSARIADAEKLAEFERYEAQGEPVGGAEMRRELRNYSLVKAIHESRSGRLTGLEAEVHAELAQGREARGVIVPTELLLEARAITTTAPAWGEALIGTTVAAPTDRRRSALKVEAMGVSVMRGLTGNLDLPRLSGSGSAQWVTEHEDAGRSDASFSAVSMMPKTVAAEYEISRRMMLQAAPALEPLLRADLGYLLAQKLDAAAIKGSGSASGWTEPQGIIGTTGVKTLTAGTLSSDLTAELISALEVDDVTGTAAFLTNPRNIALARQKKDADGHVIPMAELFHGQTVEATNQVPFTTAAAGATPAKYPLIYGEWASLVIGYWSGIDLLVNPYHGDVASKGGALLHAFLDADVVVRHPEAFAWVEVAG